MFKVLSRCFSNAARKEQFLCRSLMYIPGDKGDKMAKVAEKAKAAYDQRDEDYLKYQVPDVIMLDLEDGTGDDNKVKGRQVIRDLLANGTFRHLREKLSKSIGIRINDSTSEHHGHDINLLIEILGDESFDFICLPKVESFENIRRLYAYLGGSKDLIGMIESPLGLVNMGDLTKQTLANNLPLRAMIFGSDDYCSAMGVKRTDGDAEVEFARNMFLLQCKARGLVPIDMVEIDFNNLDKLRQSSEKSYRNGFHGRQCIHPKQLATVNRAYLPTSEEFEQAEKILDKCKLLAKDVNLINVESFKMDGKMIDRPTIRQSMNIVNRMQNLSFFK